MDKHIAEHVSCHFEGCKFTAAPKLVTLHIKLQHDSGAFDKIVKGYDKDEIEKWKEERRKKYPTLANIERKIAQKKEMDERGERMKVENKPFDQGTGFSLKQGHKSNERGKFKVRRRRRKSTGANKNQQFLSTVSVTEEMVVEDPEPRKGNENFSDDEWVGEEKGSEVKDVPVSGVLLALCTSYASDSEDENENERTNENKIISSSDMNNEPPSELKISREGDEIPNIFIEKAERSEKENEVQKGISLKDSSNMKQPTVKTRKTQSKTSIRRRPLTLLEKLLAKEIKQERNHILQCVRYIIEENFFDNKKDTI